MSFKTVRDKGTSNWESLSGTAPLLCLVPASCVRSDHPLTPQFPKHYSDD